MSEDYDHRRNMVNHPPSELTQEKMEVVRRYFHGVVKVVDAVPDGREKSLAMTKLEEALMWTMASLARDDYDQGKSLDRAGTVELSGHATGGSGVNA